MILRYLSYSLKRRGSGVFLAMPIAVLQLSGCRDASSVPPTSMPILSSEIVESALRLNDKDADSEEFVFVTSENVKVSGSFRLADPDAQFPTSVRAKLLADYVDPRQGHVEVIKEEARIELVTDETRATYECHLQMDEDPGRYEVRIVGMRPLPSGQADEVVIARAIVRVEKQEAE